MACKSKKSAVFKYFKESGDKNALICQVLKKDGAVCNLRFINKTSNLKRHLERHHFDAFESVKKEDSEDTKRDSDISRQTSVSSYFTSQKVTISMTKEKFQRHIIQLVVNNAAALQLFSSKAFLGLNGEMANKLGVSLERHDIRDMVVKEAECQKRVLKDILHGKFCFLKMDACTRQRTNYFAINVQFVDYKNEIAIRTLSVRDTQAQHTSEFIQKFVEEVLREFEIRKEHILAIVTDNASNMTKTIEKLNADMIGDEVERDDELNEGESDEALVSAVNSITAVHTIEHMRCAVHTLQLAIRDGLKEKHVHTLLSKLRQTSVMARTPKIDAILKRRTGKGAIIDQATRWGSTYLMIQRLLELKNSLIDMANPDISLTDLQWRQTHQLEELLREPYLVTKRLQAQDLTPGSFYKEWKNLIYKLSQSSSIIADAIKASMLRREKCLLDNPVLLAAIYVDPMYRVTLSEEQLNRGKAALCDIAVRMHRGSRATQFEDQSLCASGPLRNSSDSGSECEIDFEKHLDIEAKRRRTEKESRNSNSDLSPLSKFKRDFFYALNDVEKIDRSYKLDILKAIPEYPEIVQNVAYMVTALPPTQVSVERLFSALRIIRSDLRASMKEDLVEAILFLRTNSF